MGRSDAMRSEEALTEDDYPIHAPPPEGRTVRKAATALAVGALVAAMTNPQALVDWAIDLPVTWGAPRDLLLTMAEGWRTAMQAIGVDRLHTALREGLAAWRAL